MAIGDDWQQYFYASEQEAAKASALGLAAGEADVNGERRDYLQYVSQGDNDAAAGELVVFERPASEGALFHTPSLISLSPLADLVTGQRALGSIMRDLSAGKNPKNHRVALQGRKYKGEMHNPGGFDLQIGTPKSVSLATAFDRGRARSGEPTIRRFDGHGIKACSRSA